MDYITFIEETFCYIFEISFIIRVHLGTNRISRNEENITNLLYQKERCFHGEISKTEYPFFETFSLNSRMNKLSSTSGIDIYFYQHPKDSRAVGILNFL